MKTYLYPLFLFILCISCTSQKNSEEFINATEGRYLFNDNEVIEIYFKDQVLHAKWRGNDNIELLKVNDSAFYMKELNEKMVFVSTPKIHIELAPKTEHKGIIYHFKKLNKNEKTPIEYLENNQFNEALTGYLQIQQKDSLNPVIREYTLNKIGYNYLKSEDLDKAISLFKINTVLYPKSSNTFDSLASAYLMKKDTANAIENYKKALILNSENGSSLRALERITKK